MDASVIVPVYNDPAGVRTTVESLLALSYPTDDHELLVVDNGSTDQTPTVARELTAGHDHARVLVEERQGSYAARNAGIEAADGDLLAFIDADMWVESDWLGELLSVHQETDADYVGCRVAVCLPPGRETLVGRYSRATAFPVGHYIERQQFAPTCCLSVDRAVIEDVGPFRAELVSGGDGEFGRRVARAGYTQQYARHITMYHPARTTLSAVLSKAVRQGRGREQQFQTLGTGRPWHHPRNVLPPHPHRFGRRLQTDESLAIYAVFYLFTYLLKLGKWYGQLRERVGT